MRAAANFAAAIAGLVYTVALPTVASSYVAACMAAALLGLGWAANFDPSTEDDCCLTADDLEHRMPSTCPPG